MLYDRQAILGRNLPYVVDVTVFFLGSAIKLALLGLGYVSASAPRFAVC